MLDGTVIVFSDAHFIPGQRSTAFKGLLWAIQEFKPKHARQGDHALVGRHERQQAAQDLEIAASPATLRLVLDCGFEFCARILAQLWFPAWIWSLYDIAQGQLPVLPETGGLARNGAFGYMRPLL
jgi:hypothetical protein